MTVDGLEIPSDEEEARKYFASLANTAVMNELYDKYDDIERNSALS